MLQLSITTGIYKSAMVAKVLVLFLAVLATSQLVLSLSPYFNDEGKIWLHYFHPKLYIIQETSELIA